MSVTNNGNRICNITDLIQFVRDNDRSNSMFFQIKHYFKKLCTLFVIQSCCRLIQNQKFYIFCHGFCNLNQLLLSNTKGVDRCIDIFILQTNFCKHFFRLTSCLCPVDDTFSSGSLIAHKYVLSNGKIWTERQLLMNDYNAF